MSLDTGTQVTTDAVVASVATKWGMGGGTMTALFGWLTSSDAAITIGIIVTISGFIVNYIFQRRRDKREEQEAIFKREMEIAEEKRRQELHEAQLVALRQRVT